MQITLGPVLYHWKPEIWRDFYFRIADEAPIDIVSVGETVCSKRTPFYEEYLSKVIERLDKAGKQVLLSSYLLISLERERKHVENLVTHAQHLVEMNDISGLLHMGQKPHTIGPFVNSYNEGTVAFFASNGATRICLPPELPLTSIEAIAQSHPDIAIEVFSFGRIPLAISARCYHARLHKQSKDKCRFVCELDPDGLEVDTLSGEKFLSVNGVQTLSYNCVNLLPELDQLRKTGIKGIRLSPQDCDMVAIAQIFRDTLNEKLESSVAVEKCRHIYKNAPFANGFALGIPGAEWKTVFATSNGLGE